MSGRQQLGGASQLPSAARGKNAPRDSYSMPPEAIFHSEDIADTPLKILLTIRNGFLVLAGAGFVALVGVLFLFVG